MSYDEAKDTNVGDVVRTDWGDQGEVIDALDTGLSVVFTLWHPEWSARRVHSSHAWRVYGGPGFDAR